MHCISFRNVYSKGTHQSTGLCACCRRYGDLSLASLLVWEMTGDDDPSPPDAMLRNTDEELDGQNIFKKSEHDLRSNVKRSNLPLSHKKGNYHYNIHNIKIKLKK